ncbi:protein tify 10a [Phtheirospermum japonicum]|uniref:Protein TIFY n=1 Tax=Phtheirospermum japonicum TaxID=374723 RepID=A0A830B5L7_9LAMI|nr:protein tify 10a [Phtheirospermum japonicum]
MASFEKVDSGRFPGGRSNFSQTCSLLSQYLKVKGSFGELSLGLTPHMSESKGTMDFLPMIEQSGQNSGPGNMDMDMNMLPQLIGEDTLYKSDSRTRSEKETGQMTIFYAGQVIVMDDFPAGKAKEVMMLASKSSATFAPPPTAQKPAESATGSPNIVSSFGLQERARHVPQPALASDLPIARKISLARFLEKRKDRITANAPYQASKPTAAPLKPVKTEPWLGLAPELPLQIQRH